MNLITPKQPLPVQTDELHAPRPWIYLCGSCASERWNDWRPEFTHHLEQYDCTVLDPYTNPYPKHFGASDFMAQATWEFHAAERADLVVVRIDRTHMATVSLLELGRLLNAPTGDLLVYLHDEHPAFNHVRFALKEHDVYLAPDTIDLLSKVCYWIEARKEDRWLRSRPHLLRET